MQPAWQGSTGSLPPAPPSPLAPASPPCPPAPLADELSALEEVAEGEPPSPPDPDPPLEPAPVVTEPLPLQALVLTESPPTHPATTAPVMPNRTVMDVPRRSCLRMV